jgi:DNA-binding GntR family transcriptional regulator
MNTRRGKNVSRQTHVSAAYETIKDGILGNEYPPGYQVLEADLAEALGMSRTPIREAIVRLENEGLVEIIPRQGMRVVSLSASDMKEIYEVLTALETMAVDLLARRNLTEMDLVPLEAALTEMDKALENDNLDAWAEADSRFHFSLIELCGNARLATMVHQVSDQAHRARMITRRLRPKPTKSNVEHRAVLDAIRRGDWEGARQIHYDHRMRASETLLSVLEHYGLTHL